MIASDLLRWMPADCHPFLPNGNRDHVVELKGYDGCASGSRAAEDLGPVITPKKVPRPSLTARVEESHATSRHRIVCVRLQAFEPVTQSTGEPEVLFFVGTAAADGKDVLDLEGSEDIPLRALTIPAPVASQGSNALPNCPRDPAGAQDTARAMRPLRTASRSAWAFRSSPSW
mgnify:CR=1 FL=1